MRRGPSAIPVCRHGDSGLHRLRANPLEVRRGSKLTAKVWSAFRGAGSSADFIDARNGRAIPRSLVHFARVVRVDIVEHQRNLSILLLRACFPIGPNKRSVAVGACRHAFGSTLRRLIFGLSEHSIEVSDRCQERDHAHPRDRPDPYASHARAWRRWRDLERPWACASAHFCFSLDLPGACVCAHEL